MIEFTIKFLLAFSLKAKEHPKEKKSKAKEPKMAQPQIPDPPYVLRLEKTCSFAHIVYQLLPVKCKPYQIDVLCWQNAAKIYTADGTKLFKTVAKSGLTFVPVCIKHTLKDLSIDDLMAIRNAVIEFHVHTEKNKLGAAAKANKIDTIYIRETDLDQQGFINAYLDKCNASFISKKSVPSKRSLQDENAATE
ncbi:hypothetical protein HUJ05_000437 [Dendroctonus ponderosae]|nr:hypothetical protein HUJ05_000437 [Dendroctonus ponderosae]KAH1026824.1 hypothetical protein HUJ05_000437 [Dendroctonus ponderosae]